MRRMRRTLLVLLAAVPLAAIPLAGCSGRGRTGASGTDDHARSGHGAMALARSSVSPWTAGVADRTIRITVADGLRFEPAGVSVKLGETVAFTVTNTTTTAHEFVVGDQAFQARHREQMAGQPMPMRDGADGISLPAGGTKTLTYTFNRPGTLYYACHVSWHYDAGMKGTITVA